MEIVVRNVPVYRKVVGKFLNQVDVDWKFLDLNQALTDLDCMHTISYSLSFSLSLKFVTQLSSISSTLWK